MFEGILFLILLVLAVPFFVGYAVGKSSRKSPGNTGLNDGIARIQGQTEVKNYLLRYLKSQPATLKKADLLREMGESASSQTKASYYSEATESEPEVAAAADIHVEKIKDENQSINVILYVASFLLVAAAVLFIGTTVSDAIKVASAWVISIGFYAVGLVLHKNSERLKPAGVAFAGTGLALLPFAGLAMNLYVLHDPVLSWFITSLIGLGAFLYATLTLRSQVLAYLTLGFVFSLSVSSAQVLQAPLVWSFVLVILVGSLLNFVAYLKPKWLSPVFLQPVDQSGQLAVPLAIFGSWFAGSNIELWQHGVILAISALHYAVASLRPVNRQTYIFIARILASASVLVFTYDYSDSWQVVGHALTIIATLQIVASCVLIKMKKWKADSVWIWIGMALQTLAIVMWLDSPDRIVLTTTSLSLVVLTSILVSIYLKRSRYASFGVGIAVLLQLQVGKELLDTPLENYVLALLFMIESAAMLAVRFLWCKTGERLNVSASACVLYGIMAIVFVVGEPSGWQALVFFGLSLVAAGAAYVEKEPNFYILANLFLFVALFVLTDLWRLDETMRWLVTAWISGGIFYAARAYFGALQRVREAAIMMAYGLTVLFGIGFFSVFGDHTIAAGLTLIVASLLLAIEGYNKKQRVMVEIALLVATFALQRIVADKSNLDFLLYTHWWAVTLAYLAFQRYSTKDKATALNWLIAALLFFSVPTGLAALGEPEKYQLLFLFEHIGLLAIGGFINYRLITIWGATGVGLGVLYWLQDYTFLLVGLTGLGLIFFAVWRLLRKQ